jgi:hypothetical protein
MENEKKEEIHKNGCDLVRQQTTQISSQLGIVAKNNNTKKKQKKKTISYFELCSIQYNHLYSSFVCIARDKSGNKKRDKYTKIS